MAEPDTSQDAVFAFLSRPDVHGGVAVKRVDTHAASVFLAGAHAFKVKRAVRFPFLDYSTLERRRRACEAELAVNRAFAPDIYRGVVPITRQNGGFALGGDGEPAEWAVEMLRFDDEATLDRLAERGGIDAALADRLGQMVAAAHATVPVVDAPPWLDAVSGFLNQNEAAFAEMPDLFPAERARGLDHAARAAFGRIRPLLEERGARGLVRRGHGDLHLGNIALIDGRPMLFDAIEFDPLIAAGDVLYDLAFLVMDLIERDLRAAANVVLNRYLADTHREDDLDGLAALPFFLSLRAAIRAKVTAARMARADAAQRDRIARTARTYFDLACRLIAPAPPQLIAVGGLSGTGKSLLARALAAEILPDPGAVVLRSDVERKASFGMRKTERLPAAAYAPDVTAGIYATLARRAARVLAAAHSVVVDAVFARTAERETVAAAARQARVPFHGLFLTADVATRLSRVAKRAHDASDADADLVRQQERYDLGTLDWTRIDASDSPDETLTRAKASLS